MLPSSVGSGHEKKPGRWGRAPALEVGAGARRGKLGSGIGRERALHGYGSRFSPSLAGIVGIAGARIESKAG